MCIYFYIALCIIVFILSLTTSDKQRSNLEAIIEIIQNNKTERKKLELEILRERNKHIESSLK